MRKWTLNPNESRLSSNENVVVLTPKATAVLTVLAKNKGNTVTREEILRTAWKGVSVTPDLVREYVFDLRKALGDNALSPTYIETVRGKGFRLIGPVELEAEAQDTKAQRAVVAVLRPSLFSDNKKLRHLADALAEDLTTDLARFPELAVIARHSSFAATEQYADLRDAAKALGADYLIESSVSEQAASVLATVQLIRGSDGVHVWAERRGRRNSLAAIGGTIAAEVANSVGSWNGVLYSEKRHFLARQPASSLSAYEHYLLCLHYEQSHTPSDIYKAIEHGQQATRLDPDFARTWLLLWFLYFGGVVYPGFKSDQDRVRERLRCIDRAVALDPHDALILSEAAHAAAMRGSLAEVPNLVSKAMDFGTNQADASAGLASANAMLLGNVDEARTMLTNAFALNPFFPPWYFNIEARLAFAAADFDACIEIGTRCPDMLSTRVFCLLAQAMTLPVSEVRAARSAFLAHRPSFDFEVFANSIPIADVGVLSLFSEALEKLRTA